MRYKIIDIEPQLVKVGDTILCRYDPPYKVEKIVRENDGYSFLYDIESLECYLYSLNWYPDLYTVKVRRGSLKETLKLL